MILIKNANAFSVVAIALAVSSCSGDGEPNDFQGLDDSFAVSVSTASESTTGMEVADGVAMPVASVSSSQMDEFIVNPLLSEIPSELRNNITPTAASNFVINPFMN